MGDNPQAAAPKSGRLAAQVNQLLKKLDFFLENKTGKLEKKHKLLIFAGAMALPVVVFSLLVAMPKFEEIGRLQERISQQEGEISRLQAVARQIDRHRQELAEVEEQLQIASQLLPEEREIPGLLTSISNLGTDAGLDFLLFRPLREERKEFYAEIPVEISIRGAYHDVVFFLDQVSKLPRIVTVNNLNMGSPTMAEGEMLLNTTFTLLTYRFIEPEPEEE